MNATLQPQLPTLESFQAEMRDRRYTSTVVALNALVSLRRLNALGEDVSARAWNEAWALAEKAVPPQPAAKENTVSVNQSVIVHGPNGCGKTTHARQLAAHFGLTRIVDGWNFSTPGPATDTLFLTNQEPPEEFANSRRVLHFTEAMRLVKHAA